MKWISKGDRHELRARRGGLLSTVKENEQGGFEVYPNPDPGGLRTTRGELSEAKEAAVDLLDDDRREAFEEDPSEEEDDEGLSLLEDAHAAMRELLEARRARADVDTERRLEERYVTSHRRWWEHTQERIRRRS